MKRRLFLTLAVAGALAAVAGCGTTRHACGPVSCFPPYTGPTPGVAPCDRCRQSACAPLPMVPVPAPVAPPATSAFPPPASSESIAGASPVQPGPYSSAFADPYGRSPLDSGVRLLAPLPDGPDAAPDTTRLYGPSAQEPPSAQPMPSFPENKDTSPPLPVDIPSFAVAKDRVANGLQPFPDGIAWLQAHHYRTVLHVRAPGEDDSAARRQFEKHDLRYLSLEVSPNTLTKDVVDQFNRTVTEESDLPLFVYDRDGAIAGGLWYLYFRTAEGMSDERARSEAARLGFQPDQDGEQRTMWVAVQRYLSNLNP